MDDVIALFHRYKDPVYRLALSFTGSPADAEDVTQTVFLKYLETQPELEEGRERAWLLQVTANQCRDLWRRLRRRATVPLDEAQAVAVLPPREPSSLWTGGCCTSFTTRGTPPGRSPRCSG